MQAYQWAYLRTKIEILGSQIGPFDSKTRGHYSFLRPSLVQNVQESQRSLPNCHIWWL